jgi:hypothetical protein
MNIGSMGVQLGAVPGGFEQGQLANNQIEQGQLQNADMQAKQIGMAAYFRALQGLTGGTAPGGGGGPQPPQPGQPSVPMQPPAPALPPGPAAPPAVMDRRGQASPDAQGGYGSEATLQSPGGGPYPAPAPQPGAPSAAPVMASGGQPTDEQGGLRLTWQGIAHSIKANNPGVSDLALAHAVDKFVPMMAAQSQAEWRNLRTEMMGQIADVKANAWRDTAGMRADASRYGADKRAESSTYGADRRADTQADLEEGRDRRFNTGEDRRNRSLDQRAEQFKAREDRLERSLQLRTDSTWARLDQQKQQFEQRIAQGDRRQAVTEWRATVDAQHKYAMEKILSARDMNANERQKMIADQNGWYTDQIARMKNLTTQQGNLTDGGNTVNGITVENAPAPRAPAAPQATPAPQAAPEPAPAPAPAAPSAGTQLLPPAFATDPDGTIYNKGGYQYEKRGDKLIMKDRSPRGEQ